MHFYCLIFECRFKEVEAIDNKRSETSLVRNKRQNQNSVHINVVINNGNGATKRPDASNNEANDRTEERKEKRKKRLRALKRKCEKIPHLKKCQRFRTTPMPDITYTVRPIQFNHTYNASDYQWNSTESYFHPTNGTIGSFNVTEASVDYSSNNSSDIVDEADDDGEGGKEDTDEDLTTTINDMDIQYKRRAEDEKNIVKDV